MQGPTKRDGLIGSGSALATAATVATLLMSSDVLQRPPAHLRELAVPIMRQVSDADPARFRCAHTGRDCEADWIEAVASALHRVDPRFGLNGKRGDPNTLSLDVITYLLDPGNPRKVAAWDVCGSCGGSNPSLEWNEITNYATIGQPGTAIWLQPPDLAPPEPPSGPTPPAPPQAPAPAPAPPSIDTAALKAEIAQLRADLAAAASTLEAVRATSASAAIDAREFNAARHAGEFAPPPVVFPSYQGRVPFGGGTVRLTPEPR